jgi:hypothetical protein
MSTFKGRIPALGGLRAAVTAIAPITRLALRIAAWITLAVIIAIACYFVDKYGSDGLTDNDQTTVTLPDTPGPTPVAFGQKPQSSTNGVP